MKKTKSFGFTLMEILAVIAVIGIITAVVMPTYIQQAKQQQLRQSSTQLASDLARARSQSIKLNTNTSLSLTGTGYNIVIGTQAPTSRTWPAGVSLQNQNNGPTSVQYTAPLAQSSNSAYWILTGFGQSRTVRVLGVTGRAYESAN